MLITFLFFQYVLIECLLRVRHCSKYFYTSINRYPFLGGTYVVLHGWSLLGHHLFCCSAQDEFHSLHIVILRNRHYWWKGRLREGNNSSFFHYPNKSLLAPRQSARCARCISYICSRGEPHSLIGLSYGCVCESNLKCRKNQTKF